MSETNKPKKLTIDDILVRWMEWDHREYGHDGVQHGSAHALMLWTEWSMFGDASQDPLLFCCKSYPDFALELVESGIDVNVQTASGDTPLHFAVSRKNLALVQALLARNVAIDAVNEYGFTPLREAVTIAAGDIVQELLNAGADPDFTPEELHEPPVVLIWEEMVQRHNKTPYRYQSLIDTFVALVDGGADLRALCSEERGDDLVQLLLATKSLECFKIGTDVRRIRFEEEHLLRAMDEDQPEIADYIASKLPTA